MCNLQWGGLNNGFFVVAFLGLYSLVTEGENINCLFTVKRILTTNKNLVVM